MLRLPHHIFGAHGNLILNSFSKVASHDISAVSPTKLLHFAPIDKLETVCGFFEHQENRLFPR